MNRQIAKRTRNGHASACHRRKVAGRASVDTNNAIGDAVSAPAISARRTTRCSGTGNDIAAGALSTFWNRVRVVACDGSIVVDVDSQRARRRIAIFVCHREINCKDDIIFVAARRVCDRPELGDRIGACRCIDGDAENGVGIAVLENQNRSVRTVGVAEPSRGASCQQVPSKVAVTTGAR